MFFFSKLLAKIIFFIIFFFSLTIGIYVTFFIQSEVQREQGAILTNGTIFAELSSLVLYQDYLTASARGFPRFQDIAQERLRKNADIAQVMLLAKNGKIIFDSKDFSSDILAGRTGTTADRFIDNQSTVTLLQQEKTQARDLFQGKERFTEIIVPIAETGGGHVFSMRYLLSYQSLEAHKTEIYKNALLTLLPLFLLTVGAGILLAISIVRPIESLSRATEKIQQGDLSVQLSIKSHDEIGKLTAGFNQMVTTIATTQKELQEYNQKLEVQVTQRTKELQTKVDEFERMNKLMIGRELKMTELKQENQLLKQKINGV